MRLTNSLKVTFVTIFSCLAIMLGLFASTGIASAHSATALQSQTSASQSADQWRERCQRVFIVRKVFVRNWWDNPWNNGWRNGWDNGWNNSWNNGQERDFQFSDTGSNLFFNPDQFGFFNRGDEFGGHFVFKVTEVLICRGHREHRFFQFDR
jgi:hypothetical protein